MFLVDTSIWADHISRSVPRMKELLLQEKVIGHPFVLGEILLGNLKNPDKFAIDYLDLVTAEKAEDEEVFKMISRHRLYGTGIGFVDAHLLAAAFLADCRLMTRDKRLATVAAGLGVGAAL